MQLDAPIIIIGAGRSGSTLLDRMLNAHPAIHMFGETDFLVSSLFNMLVRGNRKAMHSLDEIGLLRTELERIGVLTRTAFSDLLQLQQDEKDVWGLKEIWNGDTRIVDWMIYDLTFPNATWVHLVRHPLEYARSATGWNGGEVRLDTLTNQLESWSRMIDISRERASTGRFIEIRYEDLVGRPEATLGQLFARLGLQFSASCMEPLRERWVPSSERPALSDTEMVLSAIGKARIQEKLVDMGYGPLSNSYSLDLKSLGNQTGRYAVIDQGVFGYQFGVQLAGGSRAKNFLILANDEIELNDGLGYIYWAPLLIDESDNIVDDLNSPYLLLENGVPLGPAHSRHDDVRRDGKGAWSHWGQFVLFSSSDGTDPRRNQREYVLVRGQGGSTADDRNVQTTLAELSPGLGILELERMLAAAELVHRQERELAQREIESLRYEVRSYRDENAALGIRTEEAVRELRASTEQSRRLGAELEAARDDLQAGEAANRDLHAELESVRSELCDELAANRELREQLDVETERGRRAMARMLQAVAARHTASLAVQLRRSARRFLGRTFRLVGPYAGDGGQCWVAPLGELAELADDADWQDSPLVVLEDGAPLPLPHALHDDIRNLGGGRYSCWQGAVLFSTPDGSDPNRNGRRYTLALALAPNAAQAAG